MLRFLTDRQQAENRRGNGPYYATTDGAFQRHFPYLSVNDLKQLRDKLQTENAIVARLTDPNASPRIWEYTVLPSVAAAARRESIRMDVAIATRIGLVAGILIEELRYRTANVSFEGEAAFIQLDCTTIRKLLDIAESTITTALAQLVATRSILENPDKPRSYRVTDSDPILAAIRRNQSRRNESSDSGPRQAQSTTAKTTKDNPFKLPIHEGQLSAFQWNMESYLRRFIDEQHLRRILTETFPNRGVPHSKIVLCSLIATVETHAAIEKAFGWTRTQHAELLLWLWDHQSDYTGTTLPAETGIDKAAAELARRVWDKIHSSLVDGLTRYF